MHRILQKALSQKEGSHSGMVVLGEHSREALTERGGMASEGPQIYQGREGGDAEWRGLAWLGLSAD